MRSARRMTLTLTLTTLAACAALAALSAPGEALASSYSEGRCAVTAEVISVKAGKAGEPAAVSVRVETAKEDGEPGMMPACFGLNPGNTEDISVALNGAELKAGEHIALVRKDIHIYPTPHPTEPRHPIHEQRWEFGGKLTAAVTVTAEAAPACVRLSLLVNGAEVPSGEVTLKRGDEVTLTPTAHNDSDQKLKLAYDLPCPAGEAVTWTLNGQAGALRGGCTMGVCAEPSSPMSVTVNPKESKPLGKKTFRLGKNTCFDIPEGTVTITFDTTPQGGVTSCGPAPAIKLTQTP